MAPHSNRFRLLLVTLPLMVVMTGCLDEVPLDETGGPTEEELAGDGQPEGADDDLLIESGVGVGGTLNLWDDHNYNDTRQFRYSYDSNFGNDGFNDKASSLSNRTDSYWLLYHDRDYKGPRICIRPYSRVSRLADYNYVDGATFDTWNDEITSVKKRTTSSSSCDGAPIIGVRY